MEFAMELIVPIVVLVIGLVIVLVIFSVLQAKKRREDLARLAGQLGFRFDASDPIDIPRRYSGFGVLATGHNQQAYNVLQGRSGHFSLKAFDFVYHTTQTDTDAQGHSTTREVSHYLSAVLADAGVAFKPLLIRPENFFDKIAAAFGFEDIDFESAEFSRKFYVQSSDKKFAYAIIHPRMMEFLLQNPSWTIQLHRQTLLATKGSLLTVEGFREGIDFVGSFFKQVPEFVWQELKNEARS
jgi:hypothetical protein